MSGIGELLAARTHGQEARLIVSIEWNPRESRFDAIVVEPDGSLGTLPVTSLSVDWHYDGEGWKPDFETP